LRLLLLISLLFITVSVSAQTLRGTVMDGETMKPLPHVTVMNVATGQIAPTDEQGNFSIPANTGDPVSFSLPGYHIIERNVPAEGNLTIMLLPLTVQMKEYILRDYTPFQKDSMEMTALYKQELDKKPIKPGFSSANGGGISGLIGGPVQKLSKSYKQNKRFRENFKKDMEQKYIDTKYTPALVTALTGFSGDSLAIFMNSYPMEYAFARSATELELKMWIRSNFKEYRAGKPALLKK
jgi:hypothetical protein